MSLSPLTDRYAALGTTLEKHGYKMDKSRDPFTGGHYVKGSSVVQLYNTGKWHHQTMSPGSRESGGAPGFKSVKIGVGHEQLHDHLTKHSSQHSEQQPLTYTEHLKAGGMPYIQRES